MIKRSPTAFIVAKKFNCTSEEIYTCLIQMKDKLIHCLDDLCVNYTDESIERIFKKLSNQLYEVKIKMVMNGWRYGVIIFEDPAVDIISYFMKNYGEDIKTDRFKIGYNYIDI